MSLLLTFDCVLVVLVINLVISLTWSATILQMTRGDNHLQVPRNHNDVVRCVA